MSLPNALRRFTYKVIRARVVPGGGFEPPRPCGQQILRLQCLPFHHPGADTRQLYEPYPADQLYLLIDASGPLGSVARCDGVCSSGMGPSRPGADSPGAPPRPGHRPATLRGRRRPRPPGWGWSGPSGSAPAGRRLRHPRGRVQFADRGHPGVGDGGLRCDGHG
jgi:hypothetical protein